MNSPGVQLQSMELQLNRLFSGKLKKKKLLLNKVGAGDFVSSAQLRKPQMFITLAGRCSC